jgi:hypothetical protein
MPIEVGKYYKSKTSGLIDIYLRPKIKRTIEGEEYMFGEIISINNGVNEDAPEVNFSGNCVLSEYEKIEIPESEYNAARELARSMI